MGGGRIVDGRHDLDVSGFHGDFDAEAAELAFGLLLHLLETFRRHIAGVGIKRGEHAVDGVLDQVLIRDRLDVILAYPFEHIAEQLEVLIRIVGELRALAFGRIG